MKNQSRTSLSFEPMKFGSENDLRIALTELRWLKKTNGKLQDKDFTGISEKYKFPIDFLKTGLQGFSYPKDWLISESKWFPILFSWTATNKRHSLNLYELQFDYLKTKFRSMFFLAFLFGIFLWIDQGIQVIFQLELLERLSLVIFPFILSIIALYVELRNNIGNKKTSLSEYLTRLDELGLNYVVSSNQKFIEQNYKSIIYAGNIVLNKLKSAPSMNLIFVSMKSTEIEKQPSLIQKIKTKLGLLPDSKSPQIERIPVFYTEDINIEYARRIKELKK